MWPKNENLRLLGEHWRELHDTKAALPIEMQALLLRMALKELEQAHYCGGELQAQSHDLLGTCRTASQSQ